MFYLANGQVHVRLTDATGVVIFDYPNMQVVGPSGGGGGGGGGLDPTSVATTGDIKFRPTAEVVTGWVKVNGLSVGSAASGATGRANADTQNLFVYLWTNCTNAHCAVSGGRGGSGLADFAANKQITLPDWRGRTPVGLDDMGNSAAGRIASTNVTSGGGDTPITPMATGGEANHVLTVGELAAHNHAIIDPQHQHGIPIAGTASVGAGGTSVLTAGSASASQTILAATGITIQNNGSSTAHNTMMPFMLGTWYLKL
jgi:microcystin-dependent protein